MTFICDDCKVKSDFLLKSEDVKIGQEEYEVVYFECQNCGAGNIAIIQPKNLLTCYYHIQKLEGKKTTADEFGVQDKQIERELLAENRKARKLLRGARQLSKILKF